MAKVIEFIVCAFVGYWVGWLCGMVIGAFVWTRRLKDDAVEDAILRRLDAETNWTDVDR